MQSSSQTRAGRYFDVSGQACWFLCWFLNLYKKNKILFHTCQHFLSVQQHLFEWCPMWTLVMPYVNAVWHLARATGRNAHGSHMRDTKAETMDIHKTKISSSKNPYKELRLLIDHELAPLRRPNDLCEKGSIRASTGISLRHHHFQELWKESIITILQPILHHNQYSKMNF